MSRIGENCFGPVLTLMCPEFRHNFRFAVTTIWRDTKKAWKLLAFRNDQHLQRPLATCGDGWPGDLN